ncbi:alpha/beta hydrolase [Hyphomicrobium sp.]|jgi:lysophospholipase|uniref:alpha/beta hydrolase n=1 Tax=Hyphomicrobium sp. TaxID=82 RepID=UPI002FE2031D
MKLVALAKNPVPGGAVPGELRTRDGVRLRFVRWDATRGPRRGTVCLFGGRGEFVEKYFEVVADLRRRGFAVATIDWRGQGGSSRLLANPRKGHVGAFSEYDGDLALFMKEVVLPDCPPPFLALGHSMGANVLLRNAARPGSWFERMILVSPMISLADQRVGYPQSLVRAYAEIGCLLGFGRSYIKGGSDAIVEQGPFDGNLLTSDRERWFRNKAVLDAEPALGLGSPTVGWLRAAYRSMALVSSDGFAASVRVPMMVFVAGKDEIVSARAGEDFAVGLKVGTHVLLPSARHEILQEADPIRLRFWAAFDAYLGLGEAAA